MKKLALIWGSDPETAAVYKKDGETYVLPPYFLRTYRGVGITPNGKHPIFVQEKDAGIIHEDGAAFEFSVAPSTNFRELWERIQRCAELTSERILANFPQDCEPTLSFLPAVAFDVERWKEEGEDFRMATMFGCDPQRDAFDFEREDHVVDASEHPFRYFGGHMHVSGSPAILKDVVRAVKLMAITAGCAGIAYSDVPALENRRLFKYGLPGTFRVQDYGSDNPFGKDYRYGIEYRTISCRWAGNWELAETINRWMEIGIRNLIETKLGDEILQDWENFAVRAITNTDRDLAHEILQAVEARI